MKRLRRIWVLAVGIAVALVIVAVALLSEEKGASSFSGAQTAPKSGLIQVPSALLRKTIEKIHLPSPSR